MCFKNAIKLAQVYHQKLHKCNIRHAYLEISILCKWYLEYWCYDSCWYSTCLGSTRFTFLVSVQSAFGHRLTCLHNFHNQDGSCVNCGPTYFQNKLIVKHCLSISTSDTGLSWHTPRVYKGLNLSRWGSLLQLCDAMMHPKSSHCWAILICLFIWFCGCVPNDGQGVTCGRPALGRRPVNPPSPPDLHTPHLHASYAQWQHRCILCNWNMFYIATQGSFRLGVTPEPPSPVPPQSRPWSLYCLAQWLHAELWSLRHTELSSHVPFQLESLATINWGRFAKPQVVDFGSLNLLFGSLLPNSRGGTKNWVTVESFSFCARSFHEGENTASPVEDKSKYGALVCKHAKRWISSGNQASVTDWWEINQSPTPQGLAWENLTKSELRAVSFRQIQQAGSTAFARFIVHLCSSVFSFQKGSLSRCWQ